MSKQPKLIRDILRLIEKYQTISLDILAKELGLPITVVGKVIEKMVSEGILLEQDLTCSNCSSCPLKYLCSFYKKPSRNTKIKIYRINKNL